MTKEMLKGLIELVSEEDIETLYNVVVKFIPEKCTASGRNRSYREGR